MDRKRVIVLFLILIGLGTAYVLWLEVTGLAVPCMFRKVTGFRCPGCGVTGMLVSLVKWDLQSAYEANPFLLITGPLLLAEVVYSFVCQTKRKKLPVWNERLVYLYAAALCIFGVCRNF